MKIGDRVKFCPAAFSGQTEPDVAPKDWQKPHRVVGVVDYINAAHGWCNVRYEVHGYVLHEGFKIVSK